MRGRVGRGGERGRCLERRGETRTKNRIVKKLENAHGKRGRSERECGKK